MKLFCAGIKRGFGVGKESKADYNMMNMHTLSPIQTGKFGGMTVEGFGFEQIEMPVMSAALIAAASTIKFPCVLDVECELRPYRGEYKTAIVGFTPVAKAA